MAAGPSEPTIDRGHEVLLVGGCGNLRPVQSGTIGSPATFRQCLSSIIAAAAFTRSPSYSGAKSPVVIAWQRLRSREGGGGIDLPLAAIENRRQTPRGFFVGESG